MFIQEIWRYPVKSMAGELMKSARLSGQGIEGDRVVQVRGARGQVLTSRTHPKLLGRWEGTLIRLPYPDGWSRYRRQFITELTQHLVHQLSIGMPPASPPIPQSRLPEHVVLLAK